MLEKVGGAWPKKGWGLLIKSKKSQKTRWGWRKEGCVNFMEAPPFQAAGVRL